MTEAEKALLALGPRLRWKAVPDSECGEEYEARTDGVAYTIAKYPDPTDCLYEAYQVAPSVVFCEPLFATVVNAKAACERHNATGKWEQ